MATEKSSGPVTLGSLILKDLKRSYFLPCYPSTYRNDYCLHNDKKYRVFDHPPPPLIYYESIYPFRNMAAMGDKVPVLCPHEPPAHLILHWKKCLPAFASPVCKTLKDGLSDDVPIVTLQAMQQILPEKHSVDPDLLYELQLKSTILAIGAPCPRHFQNTENLSFPCLVKVDQCHDGEGNRVAENAAEVASILSELREELHWTDGVLFQEFIDDIREIPSFQFYLHKSGEVFWLGTSVGQFEGFYWEGANVDWSMKDNYYNLVHDQFTQPIVKFLHRRGYFGIVTFEVLVTDRGLFLIDLNPRVSAETAHLLIARHLAEQGLGYSCVKSSLTVQSTVELVTDKANAINSSTDEGKVIIMSATEQGEHCTFYCSLFAKTKEKIQCLEEELVSSF